MRRFWAVTALILCAGCTAPGPAPEPAPAPEASTPAQAASAPTTPAQAAEARGTAAQAAAVETASALPGVWELVSYTVTGSDGVARFPFGQEPRGQIIYTESGQMSVQLMRSDYDLTPFMELDLATALEEMGLSAFFAYWGTYEVDEAAGTVTHEIAGCLFPDWVGASQVRSFRFDDAGHLVLWAQLTDVGEAGDLYELRWARVGPGGEEDG